MFRPETITEPRPTMPAGITVTGFGPVVGRFIRVEDVAGSNPATRTNTMTAGKAKRIADRRDGNADN